MSDEEYYFESEANAEASYTYQQQASTIRKNGYIVIRGRPCKVVEVSTCKAGKYGHPKCHFVGIDIFTSRKMEDIFTSTKDCEVSLLTDDGNTRDDVKLPADEQLLAQINDGFAQGKDLICSVMSCMGEHHICGIKETGPK